MELAILGTIFLLAGIAIQLTGFGVATVSMSLLPFLLPLGTVIPLVALIATTTTGVVAWRTKSSKLWKHMTALIGGAAIGVPIGILLPDLFNEELLRTLLGVILIGASSYGLLRPSTLLKATIPRSGGVGVLAGFLNASLNVDGPVVGLYASSTNAFGRLGTRDLIATYMFFAGLFTIAGHFLSGRFTIEIAGYYLLALPFLALGMFIGAKIFAHLDERSVRKLIHLLVLTAGVLMLL